MDWSDWRRHFEANALRPLPPVSDEVREIPEALRPALARSLAIFQLGETGEGRIAREIWSAQLAGIDAHYCLSLGMFVREEGRHARILAALVRATGGRLLAKNWTARLFSVGRRLLGVRFELVVLLCAEVIGISFYGTLAERLPAGSTRDALDQIRSDERDHLRFHGDFFRTQTPSSVRRALFRAAFWSVGLAALLVVMADHRPLLQALGIPLREAARRFARVLGEADAACVSPAPRRCARDRAFGAALARPAARP